MYVYNLLLDLPVQASHVVFRMICCLYYVFQELNKLKSTKGVCSLIAVDLIR